jgi:hypothetical protein
MIPGREPLEPQEPFRLNKVISRLDRYIDPINSSKENFIINLQYDNLPINYFILYRI